MNTLHHLSQQAMLTAHVFLAALVMLGLGLEGLPADQALATQQASEGG